MIVEFDRLECVSAFDIAATGASAPAFGGRPADSSSAIRLVELKEVLYLPNILEPGQSICVAEGGVVPRESALDPFAVTFLKTMLKNSPAHQARHAGDIEFNRFPQEVCILGNLFSRAFGHWTEELLKVVILEQSGRNCLYVMPTMPSFARAFLLFLGIDENRIVTVNTPTLFERVVFTTAISHENVSEYPDALSRLRAVVQSRLGAGSSPHGSRLWLERGAGLNNSGITTNKEEVYRSIGKYGFNVIDMATLSIADQLRAMQGAKMIAGPHGSQFVHAQFMPVSSTVIECFSPMYVNPSILQICKALDHSYRMIVSRCNMVMPYQHGRDLEVDCEHLELVLDSLPAP